MPFLPNFTLFFLVFCLCHLIPLSNLFFFWSLYLDSDFMIWYSIGSINVHCLCSLKNSNNISDNIIQCLNEEGKMISLFSTNSSHRQYACTTLTKKSATNSPATYTNHGAIVREPTHAMHWRLGLKHKTVASSNHLLWNLPGQPPVLPMPKSPPHTGRYQHRE